MLHHLITTSSLLKCPPSSHHSTARPAVHGAPLPRLRRRRPRRPEAGAQGRDQRRGPVDHPVERGETRRGEESAVGRREDLEGEASPRQVTRLPAFAFRPFLRDLQEGVYVGSQGYVPRLVQVSGKQCAERSFEGVGLDPQHHGPPRVVEKDCLTVNGQ